MKWVRFGLVLLFVLGVTSMSAQANTAAKSAAAKPGAAAKSPEDMSKDAVAKWKDVLKLTDEQVPQFEAAMTESYQKMAEAKTASAGDKTKMKESMKTILTDRDQALAKILTPEQMKTYHAKMEKNTAKAKEHMGSYK